MANEKKGVQSHGPGCEPDSARTWLKARDDLARATTEFDTLRGDDGGDRRDGEAVGRLGGRTIAVDCVDSVFSLFITANLQGSQATRAPASARDYAASIHTEVGERVGRPEAAGGRVGVRFSERRKRVEGGER